MTQQLSLKGHLVWLDPYKCATFFRHPPSAIRHPPSAIRRPPDLLPGGSMFSRLLIPTSRFRRRNPSMTYGADDRPPSMVVWLLAVQHAAMALALVTYVVVAANIAELSQGETQTLVTGSILSMAFGTILQAIGGRFGAGAIIAQISNPFVLTIFAVAFKSLGLAAVFFIAVADGLTQTLVSRILPLLRTLFPPTVVGVVVCLGGLGLIESAVTSSLGMIGAGSEPDGVAVAISALSLGTMMAFSIWGSTTARLFGLVAGISAGFAVSWLMGWTVSYDVIQEASWLGLPSLVLPTEIPDLTFLVPIILIALMSAIDGMGVVVLMDKMDDADWRRVDMKMVGRGLRANGLANMVGAIFGGMPTGMSSANVGLCHVSRTSSRIIGLTTGLLIGSVAFVPVVVTFLVTLPQPVLGAIQVYAAAYLITSGMEMVCGRALDSRGVFMVGTALVVAMGFTLVPRAHDLLPEGLQPLADSTMVSGGVVAVLLNLIFRMGTRSKVRLILSEEQASNTRQLADLVEMQCARWSTRRDVAQRATLSIMEGAEALAMRGRKLLALEGAFDEYNLTLCLVHKGTPLELAAREPVDLQRALDGDDADFEASVNALSSVMLRNLANKVRAEERKDGSSGLELYFEH
jgi:xanthine/uracil permease